MSKAKTERNTRLIKLRLKNADKWSWAALGEEFNINRQTAAKIFKAYLQKKEKLSTE